MTKAHPSTPFAPIFAAETRPSVQAEQEARQPLPILWNPCAWCEDPAELARLNADYPGQVSHTMCDACSVRFLAAIDAKAARAAWNADMDARAERLMQP